MSTVISCSAKYGRGGVGQHFAQVVEEARASGDLGFYLTPAPKPNDAEGIVIYGGDSRWLSRYSPFRFSAGWRNHLYNDLFDHAVARWLMANRGLCPSTFIGFVGRALRSFKVARRVGVDRLELVALNTHVEYLRRQHERARKEWPLDRSWLNRAQVRKTLREYEEADVIHVHSDLTRDSFLEYGVPEGKLRRMYLRADDRFTPPTEKSPDGVFRIVYVGSVTSLKGVPVLVEAFQQFGDLNAELTIVGGWASRPMRLYMERAMREDERIRMRPGDPLPHLQRADVYIHPSYEDGFGYAVAEAIACGVPVVTTDQTGAKELLTKPKHGSVVPAGNVEALAEHIIAFADLHLSPSQHPEKASPPICSPSTVARKMS